MRILLCGIAELHCFGVGCWGFVDGNRGRDLGRGFLDGRDGMHLEGRKRM